MPQSLELLIEAERRGILPPGKVAILAEARNRGLVPTGSADPRRTQQPAQQDSAASRFLGGVGSGLDPRPLVQAAMHPIQTAKGIVSAQGEQFGKAKEALGEGRYSEAFGHGLAGAVPLIGPGAAEMGERIGSGDGAGGLGEAATAMFPMGSLGLARHAKVPVAGATRALPEILQRSARNQYNQALGATTGPMKRRSGRVTPELLGQRVTGSLEKIRETSLRNADEVAERLSAAEDRVRNKTVTEIIEVPEPVAPTSLRESLGQHDAAVTEAWKPGTGTRARAAEGEMFPTVPDRLIGQRAVDFDPTDAPRTRTRTVEREVTRPTMVDTKPVIDWLQKKKRELTGASVEGGIIGNEAGVRNIAILQEKIASLGDTVPYDQLVRIRRVLDREVAEGGGFFGASLKDRSALAAKSEAANAIRNVLGKEFPDVARINAEFSLWKTTADVIEATQLRRTGQSVPMGQQIAQAAGAGGGLAAGGLGGAVVGGMAFKGLRALLQSPKWKTVSAVKKQQLADAIVSGNADTLAKAISVIVIGSQGDYRPPSMRRSTPTGPPPEPSLADLLSNSPR